MEELIEFLVKKCIGSALEKKACEVRNSQGDCENFVMQLRSSTLAKEAMVKEEQSDLCECS
jgi:hypothetical protein